MFRIFCANVTAFCRKLRAVALELWMIGVLAAFFVLRVLESQTVSHILAKFGITR